MEYQHEWKIFVQEKYVVNQVDISGVPIFKVYVFAGTLGATTR